MEGKKENKGAINPDNNKLIENPFCTITFASILESQGYYKEAKKIYEAICLKEPAKQAIILRRLERLNGLISG